MEQVYKNEGCWPPGTCSDDKLLDVIVGNPIYCYQILKRLIVQWKKLEAKLAKMNSTRKSPIWHKSNICWFFCALFTRVTLSLCSHCQGDKPYQAEVWSHAYRKWPPGCRLCPQQASQHLQIRHIRLHWRKHNGTLHSCQARCQRHFLLGQVSLKSLF